MFFHSHNFSTAISDLPHGPEFRFVDSLELLDPGRAAVGRYLLKPEAFFLPGHFPGRPLLPGVLMIEALAQVAGIAAQTDPDLPPLADLRLTAVRQCKILGTIAPGQTLRIEAEISGRLGGLVQAAGKIVADDGAVLLEGQITLSGAQA